ncbi:hypothetical protein V6Z11_1Z016700 [Gossypium hirsutum]
MEGLSVADANLLMYLHPSKSRNVSQSILRELGSLLFKLVVVVDPEAYTYDDEVLKKAEAMGKPGLVEIYAKEDSFIFTVESTGAIKASQLVLNAIEIVKQKLDAVRLSEDTVEADDQFGELGAHMQGG